MGASAICQTGACIHDTTTQMACRFGKLELNSVKVEDRIKQSLALNLFFFCANISQCVVARYTIFYTKFFVYILLKVCLNFLSYLLAFQRVCVQVFVCLSAHASKLYIIRFAPWLMQCFFWFCQKLLAVSSKNF